MTKPPKTIFNGSNRDFVFDNLCEGLLERKKKHSKGIPIHAQNKELPVSIGVGDSAGHWAHKRMKQVKFTQD